jgi:hypothetical protein
VEVVGEITQVRGVNYAMLAQIKLLSIEKFLYYGFGIRGNGIIDFIYINEKPHEGYDPAEERGK